ncbi:lytic transglycosylase domain-containing protein [Pseudaminobacter arsenicus]|uniref:Lytic transglycosylase domain-containing protein n=1 Tax=Borborobacter arsenicus TaxID=1851146 RepID=A0A432VCF4_9HYPH|nr:transglycosylase SLT domain-containing protein [Pseudaminobacter arsenicus]RUM99796.1 lytic transglycosylase domain-containing protein [Pseudaminobacter arsenicus]
MKRWTVLTAAFAVGLTSFAAHSQPHPSMSGRLKDNSVVTPAVKTDKPEVEKAEVTPKKESKRAASTQPKKKPAAKAKTAQAKSKKASSPKSVVMKSRKKGKKLALDMMQTASIGKKGAKVAAKAAASKDPRYGKLVAQYAASYGVPVSLAHAVIRVESNYRADARGSAGEIGLMQIKPSTARMMGYSGGSKGLFDPETNIKYGMKYLAKAHSLGGGTTCGTILKYNAGHAAKRMNPVSSAYCGKVLQHLAAN